MSVISVTIIVIEKDPSSSRTKSMQRSIALQVAMGAVDLDQIVAGLHGAGEAARILLDLGDRGGAALLLAARHHAGGGAARLMAAAGARHLASPVVELHAGSPRRSPVFGRTDGRGPR